MTNDKVKAICLECMTERGLIRNGTVNFGFGRFSSLSFDKLWAKKREEHGRLMCGIKWII